MNLPDAALITAVAALVQAVSSMISALRRRLWGMASLFAARYGPLLRLRFAGDLNGDCDVPKAYWIASVDVTEPEGYQAYVAANAAAFAKYNGRFLARGPGDILEGNPKPRNVVIEFDSHEQAVACFHSAEYQAAKAFRAGKADFNLSIVPGYEP